MSGNLGYLFTKGFYRNDDNANENAALGDDVIKRKIQRITGASPLSGPDSPLLLTSPRRKPVRSEAEQTLEEMLKNLAAAHNRNRGSTVAVPSQPQPEEDDFLKREHVYSLKLKVLYPGLYAGIGYEHGQLDSDFDIKTGFSFDYTTGLPYLPGSSVKGALRSCFINSAGDTLAALQYSCGRRCRNRTCTEHTLLELEKALFGNRLNNDGQTGAAVFYDAFPCTANNGLMATDNITPHKEALRSPNPVRTLKIKTGVTIEFFFGLPDPALCTAACTIGASVVVDLFSRLLCDWGIGAKTNIGYGSLAPISKPEE